jgi:hypothetical protein
MAFQIAVFIFQRPLRHGGKIRDFRGVATIESFSIVADATETTFQIEKFAQEMPKFKLSPCDL